MGRSILLASLVALSGCLAPSSSRCGQLYCPVGTTCAPDLSRCIAAASRAACESKPDNSTCNIAGSTAAFCIKGVCTAQVCGDGIVEGDEVCDKGTENGRCNGCASDCKSTEICGDGIIDGECGEECDAGKMNADVPNATCRASCKRQRCGDHIVDNLSGEDCDGTPNPTATCAQYGFYAGTIGCSAACRNDTSMCSGFCGDGIVNGSEPCDATPPTGQTCLTFGYDVGGLACSRSCTPDFSACKRLGWQNLSPTFSFYAIGVWGASADDVWAVGSNGAALHWDGKSWTAVPTGTTKQLSFVSGTSTNDVYAVGDSGTILHWNGSAWSSMNSGDTLNLWSVWAANPRTVFAVGDGGHVLLGDGKTWTPMQSNFDGSLYSVWGTGSSDVWAAGSSADGTTPVVLHYDGGSWSTVTPTNIPSAVTTVYGVWGLGTNDVWLVCDQGTIMRWDGTNWTAVPTGGTETLFTVWGTSDNDVWVGGDQGTILHWDGASWSPVSSGTTNPVFWFWAANGFDIFGAAGSALLRFTGGPTWALVNSGVSTPLKRVWGSSPSNVFAVGQAGTIVHFDGSSWSTMSSNTTSDLWGVWGDSDTDVFAVGLNGTILRYWAGSWTQMTVPGSVTGTGLSSVWGTGPDDVWATGAPTPENTGGHGGVVLHWDGNVWTQIALPTDVVQNQLNVSQPWGRARDDVWFATAGARILHWDGNTMSETFDGAGSDVWGVWGSGGSGSDVYAFGDVDGPFLHHGGAWQKMTYRFVDALDYAAATSDTDVFAFNYQGNNLYHYDGVDWAPMRTPPNSSSIYAAWMTPTVGYVVGDSGMILRLDRHCTATETDCSNRWDDDCDGKLNCADPDCAGNSYCTGGGPCATPATLACGAMLSGTTVGAAPTLERYACSPRLESSGEVIYKLTAAATGNMTVNVAGIGSADLDLIVLAADANGACEPLSTCVAASATSSTSESVSFNASAGTTYFIIVDGYKGAAGPYTISVECP